MDNIVDRLRTASKSLRVRPMPLSDFIPLLQQAADHIERLEASASPVGVQPYHGPVDEYGTRIG